MYPVFGSISESNVESFNYVCEFHKYSRISSKLIYVIQWTLCGMFPMVNNVYRTDSSCIKDSQNSSDALQLGSGIPSKYTL